MNKKVIIAFTMVGLVSCPMRVLGVDALAPVSYVASGVNDFTFTKAFFNQFSTLVNYDLKLFYPLGITDGQKITFRNNALNYRASSGATPIDFTDWDTSNNDFAFATLNSTWKGYFNEVLFSRNFNGGTGKAEQYPEIRVDKVNVIGTSFDTDLTLTIRSAIRFRIAPAEMLLSWSFTEGDADDIFAYGISFFNNNELLNSIDFPQISATTALDTYKAVFPITLTNVNALTFVFTMIDPTGNSNPRFTLHEFNLFAASEIAVPDNADDTTFGIEYIQVEWWDILGHLNNALWWLTNESFLAPVFQWIDDYIISFINVIFNMLGSLIGL